MKTDEIATLRLSCKSFGVSLQQETIKLCVMEKEQKIKAGRIAAAAVLLAGAVAIEKGAVLPLWQLLIVYLVPYLVAGYDVIGETAEHLFSHHHHHHHEDEGEDDCDEEASGGHCHCHHHSDEGNWFAKVMDEDFLMTVATLGALTIGFLPGAEAQFAEAVAVMLFFQLGELFEDIAEDHSRKSISQLMDIRPDTAHLVSRGTETASNGADTLHDIAAGEIQPGDIILVKPGEKVPADGTVTSGESSLDTVALTGESLPRKIHEGDDILSGCVNLSGAVYVKVTKPFGESTASKVLDLVEHAAANKSKSEHFITKFARIYTPIVVGLALLVAVTPPLLTGGGWSVWLYRALTFLVVSCPCALVISVPLTFFGGIGGASRQGILIKGSNYIETLSRVKTIAFDKTGTMTHGVFEVTAVHDDACHETGDGDRTLLHLAAHAERYSTHPIANSLRQAWPDEQDGCEVADVEEIAGKGVCARVNGRRVSVGNSGLMESLGAHWQSCRERGTIVHVAVEGEYAGHIVVADKLKDDAAEAVRNLRREGVERLVMLTGDKEEVAADIARKAGITEYRAELLPADKVALVEELLAERKEGEAVAFVGDGINDAPVLARADIGIAMGALGSDAAIEAADVVLMDDKPSKIAAAIRGARRTMRIAHQNIWFAIGIKTAVLLLAFLGLATMWMAVFADVGVTVLCVINATRTLKKSRTA